MSSQLQQPLYFKLVDFVACYEANCKAVRLRVFPFGESTYGTSSVCCNNVVGNNLLSD